MYSYQNHTLPLKFLCKFTLRTRSDFEKHLTIKNCDKTVLKIILRLKNC